MTRQTSEPTMQGALIDTFDPADPQCWIAHGRSVDHAEAIASAWQRFPDLPASMPAEVRMAQVRARVAAMCPFMDRLSEETRRAREIANFTFVENALARGTNDPRQAGIIEGRERHGFSWDEAVQYADGRYAASAGWESRFMGEAADGARGRRLVAAYDLGFRDGGGRPDDLFDTARRAYLAVRPAQMFPPQLSASRLPPSQWPAPTDKPRPARWDRRLLLLGREEIDAGFLAAVQAKPDSDLLTILTFDGRAAHIRDNDGCLVVGSRLAAALQARDFDDILVAAQGDDFALIEAHATSLPLCRTMERTRNTRLQQWRHFRVWLARGLGPGDVMASGHIRWGKAVRGLTGKLGEFTARYAGPAQPRGHRIIVELPSGAPACGFRTVHGVSLDPQRIISNRAKLRETMMVMLRDFAAALPEPSALSNRTGISLMRGGDR